MAFPSCPPFPASGHHAETEIHSSTDLGQIQYSTTVGTATCLEGLDVDAELPEDVTKSLLAQLTGLTEASAKRANEAASRAEAAADGANEAASRAAGSILRGEASGTLAHAEDAYAAPPLGLTVYGASVQDGTPSPDAPKPIASVTEAALKVCGKNLFGDVGTRTVSGVTFSQEPDGTVIVKGTPTKPYTNMRYSLDRSVFGQAVTVTCAGNVGNGASDAGAVYPQITIENASGANTNAGLYANMEKLTMDIPSDARSASVAISCGEDTTQARDARLKVIASIGRSAEDYEPHTSASIPINLQGNELCSLPNGVRDEVRIDGAGNFELVKRVAITRSAASDGIEGTPGADCMSSTGELADGATVLYPLPAAQIIPLGKVELPTLPAPVANAWVESDVPTECGLRYVRDVNIVIERLETQLAAVAGAVSMLDVPTVIPELEE